MSAQPEAHASMYSELPPPRFIQLSELAQNTAGSPDWHASQRPQPFCAQNTPTRSPTFRSRTPAPTSTTTPVGSCPATSGGVTGKCPW